MSFDWWTLALQTINLLVLLWILSHFLFKPVSEILEKRQAAATDALDHARSAKAEAEAALAELRSGDAAVAERRAKLLATAQAEAERARRELLDAAREDAAKLRAEAQAEIQRSRSDAERAMQDEAADLAVDISRRLLDRLPAQMRSAGFIDGLAEAVGATAGADAGRSRRFGSGGGPRGQRSQRCGNEPAAGPARRGAGP